jgi:hypothetical protein
MKEIYKVISVILFILLITSSDTKTEFRSFNEGISRLPVADSSKRITKKAYPIGEQQIELAFPIGAFLSRNNF